MGLARARGGEPELYKVFEYMYEEEEYINKLMHSRNMYKRL